MIDVTRSQTLVQVPILCKVVIVRLILTQAHFLNEDCVLPLDMFRGQF